VVLVADEYTPADVGEAQLAVRLDRISGRLCFEQRVGRLGEAGHRVKAPSIAEERPRLSSIDQSC
jgi:hypothetical protein